MSNNVVLTAANLVAMLEAGATLVREIESIRVQVEANQAEVWREVQQDYAASVEGFNAAVATSGHYHDARTVNAPAPASVPDPSGEGEPAPGEGDDHGAVTGA